MKTFTENDLHRADTKFPTVYAEQSDLIDSPLDWQKRGLTQTASGYGSKLNTGRKINFNGKLYRLYAICYSNCASVYFTTKGRKIYVN